MATRKLLTNLTTSANGAIRRSPCGCALFSTSSTRQSKKHFKLVVIGGGTGGCSTAAKFASRLGKGQVAVIEPNEIHYYQPMWTMVGGGVKKFENSGRPMKSVLPTKCEWIQEHATTFDPANNLVTTESGTQITYDYMVVAMGLQLNYHKIKGLPEAFEVDDSLCSNYSSLYVSNTFPALERFQGGNAIFTFPAGAVKCAGAPQKIMYMAEHYLRNSGKREKTNIMFNTALGVIFGVKKYAERLLEVVKDRNIKVNYRRDLIEVRPDKKEAVFADLDNEGKTETFKYDYMHITPKMSAPDILKSSPLSNADGFLELNQYTLQHVKYPNVFGLGDCTNVPTSKTAAAVAGMGGVMSRNLRAVMDGRAIKGKDYDGYTSCPLITGYGKCILAEFDFKGQPLETFPVDQGKERFTMYLMKRDMMPEMYWHLMLTGYWNGPGFHRRVMHLGMSR